MQQITLTVDQKGQATLKYHGVTPMKAAMLMADCAASILRQLEQQEEQQKPQVHTESEANVNGILLKG